MRWSRNRHGRNAHRLNACSQAPRMRLRPTAVLSRRRILFVLRFIPRLRRVSPAPFRLASHTIFPMHYQPVPRRPAVDRIRSISPPEQLSEGHCWWMRRWPDRTTTASFGTTLRFAVLFPRSRACQADVKGIVNMVVFRPSHHGQRNGRRAPHLSVRDFPSPQE
jgi:hypothetical protein